jgi:TatD DNase family protein
MIIDTHCHLDMFPDPLGEAKVRERNKLLTISMTNLPSHFELGYNYLLSFRHVRMALGLHPLRATDHKKESSLFSKLLDKTSYIGEIGLDFSKEGISTKDIQIKSFDFVLESIKNKSKIVSLHSRRAEKEILEMLIEKRIDNVIFHWYSGSLSILKKIVDCGFYFSINSAMIQSENGRKIIDKIPKSLILTETDAPFIENSSIKKTLEYLSSIWVVPTLEVELIIQENFNRLLQKIR